MRLFFVQLRGELRKVFSRRRTYLAFAAIIFAELVLLMIVQLEPVRVSIHRAMRSVGLAFEGNFSGLSLASYMMGNTTLMLGNFFVALIAGESVAKEFEDGTLRTVFCRPVPRGSVLLQKIAVCAIYATVVTWFIGISSLGFGLFFEGPGNLVVWSMKEPVMARFDFEDGLRRYWLALALYNLSVFSVMSLAFAFSCTAIKPAAATALALTFFIADDSIRDVPQFRSARPFFVMTRIVSWLHAYDSNIPWPMLAKNYSILFCFDAGLVGVGYWRFRRLNFKP